MNTIIVKNIIQFLLVLAAIVSTHVQKPESPSWLDYTSKRANNDIRNSVLLDYSYARYHFSEKELPDVSSWNTISVINYGAIPNDGNYDDAAIYDAIEAAKAANVPTIIHLPLGRYIVSSKATKDRPSIIDKSSKVTEVAREEQKFIQISEVYNIHSQLISKKNHTVNGGKGDLHIEDKPKSIYFVKDNIKKPIFVKLIKE